MRIVYLLSVIFISLALSNCASVEQPANNQIHPAATSNVPITPPTCKEMRKRHNPYAVSFYTKGHPKLPYEVVGEESISKFNVVGHKRQEAYIRDGMRELAAAMGGDAVIDIKHDSKSISGTVVAFTKDKSNKEA